METRLLLRFSTLWIADYFVVMVTTVTMCFVWIFAGGNVAVKLFAVMLADVFGIGHQYQIIGGVIFSVVILVVYVLMFQKWTFQNFGHDESVFQNIPGARRVWMLWAHYDYITTFYRLAALPIRCVFSLMTKVLHGNYCSIAYRSVNE